MDDKSKEGRKAVQDLNQVDKHIRDSQFDSAKKLLFQSLKERMHSYLKEQSPHSDLYFAHYTSVDTIYSILKDHRSEDKKTKENQGSYLRLYDAFSLNDPNEGKHLKTELSKDYKWLENADDETEAFVCSFVSSEKPIGDKLKYWQSYGKDGLGCSIQLASSHTPPEILVKLSRVIYENEADKIQTVKSTFRSYFERGKQLHEKLPEQEKNDFATEFWKLFDEIKFLHKSDDYGDEEEYRYVVIPEKQSEIKYDFRSAGPYLRGYIEIPELGAKNILHSGSKVFIGPRVENRDRLCRNLKQMANNVGLAGPSFHPSRIQYQKAW